MLHVPHQAPFFLTIGDRKVGPGQACFVIAEIGNNHNGDFDRAIALIDAAKAAGADCAKFQMRKLDEVYRASSLSGAEDDLSVEYTLDLLRRFELSTQDQKRLLDYCNQVDILYLCTPWDPSSVKVLDGFGVPAFKVASADLTNLPLQAAMVATKKPLIASTGMSTTAEIEAAISFLNGQDASFALLHCQSTYPAALHNINLRFMERLREMHPLVGYSGHERGHAVTLAAVALGAIIIERHITLDRMMEGPDHAASLEPAEYAALMTSIREVELALGPIDMPRQRILSQGELINRENLGKSVVAAHDLAEGAIIRTEDLLVRSPGQGLAPIHLPRLIGQKAKRRLKADDYFFLSDIENTGVTPREYKFNRPWGIPVRYHDVKAFLARCKPDLLEFHLSYSDMGRPPADYFDASFDIDFAVHAPELFEGSRLMDLATDDEEYRRYSVRQTQRVIDITRSLKKYFPKTARPPIVCNVGGFSMDAPFASEKKTHLYETFAKSLSELDVEGVEILPQTMAPFPWHFGGQRHQNIFIFPEETAAICRKMSLNMCVDISHTRLAANHFGFDFYEGIAVLGPYTRHYHLGDSRGVDGEGLQIGDGDTDFGKLGEIMARTAPSAWFIPEIWQGHKNLGEGFWIALERLEPYL
ncbi:MAG TPA: N-acetylneuraminate synthase family protein [Rhizomicrobium sp.]|nr:N-acetylneuraminate synthase family protein [Rhizomicrobium sp.]